jgi:hypothetical protein
VVGQPFQQQQLGGAHEQRRLHGWLQALPGAIELCLEDRRQRQPSAGHGLVDSVGQGCVAPGQPARAQLLREQLREALSPLGDPRRHQVPRRIWGHG